MPSLRRRSSIVCWRVTAPPWWLSKADLPGVAQSFSNVWRHLGVVTEPHLANWNDLSNVAGPARSREMIDSGT